MKFNKILVPVGGTKADEGAIDLACSLAKSRFKRTILAVHIIPVERSLPLGAEVGPATVAAENIMDDIAKRIDKHGCAAEIDILQAREVGPAIVQVAQEQRVDLILIGITYKKQFGEFCLGDVVPYVLKNAPCRVILDHQLGSEDSISGTGAAET